MMAWAAAGAALAVALIFVGLLMTRGVFDLWQRLGLSSAAGGLIVAGAPRLMGQAPGPWDLMFLGGLALFFVRTYGATLWRTLDGMDGDLDGQLHWPVRKAPPAPLAANAGAHADPDPAPPVQAAWPPAAAHNLKRKDARP